MHRAVCGTPGRGVVVGSGEGVGGSAHFPGLLFPQGLSDYAEPLVLTQFDTEPQRCAYTPAVHRVTMFGVATSAPC